MSLNINWILNVSGAGQVCVKPSYQGYHNTVPTRYRGGYSKIFVDSAKGQTDTEMYLFPHIISNAYFYRSQAKNFSKLSPMLFEMDSSSLHNF